MFLSMPIICVSQGGGNSWQGHGKRTYVFFFGGALALAWLEGFWDLDLPLLFAFDLALLHHLVIIIIALLIQIDLTGIRVVWDGGLDGYGGVGARFGREWRLRLMI